MANTTSANIKGLLAIAIPVFIVHAIEEYSMGILTSDPFFLWATLHGLPTVVLYLLEQVVLVVLLLWALYQPRRWLLVLIGLLFLFEFTHFVSAAQHMSYYPGLVTAIILVVLGLFLWKELLKNKI